MPILPCNISGKRSAYELACRHMECLNFAHGGRQVKPSFSLYLDLSRIVAAFAVFIGHASGKLFTGGLLWQVGLWTHDAVIIFFVLSGFVIAYVTSERENEPVSFCAARISRLYSVIIPALGLTMICDRIGLSIEPRLYYDGPWGYPIDNSVMRYVASLFLVNQAWGADLEPGINVPFWSLSFEGFYYATFATFFFLRSPLRFALPALVLMAGGPQITIMFPIWLMGLAAQRLISRFSLGPRASWSLAVGGLLVILAMPILRDRVSEIAADFVIGFAFGVHLVGASQIGLIDRLRGQEFGRWVKYLATLTFPLYLFHRPLIQVLTVVAPGDPEEWLHRCLVIGGTIVVVVILGQLCDLMREPLRDMARHALQRGRSAH